MSNFVRTDMFQAVNGSLPAEYVQNTDNVPGRHGLSGI
jgi:hypothetical protein